MTVMLTLLSILPLVVFSGSQVEPFLHDNTSMRFLQSQTGFCCFAGSVGTNRCGTCYPTAIAAPGHYCAKQSTCSGCNGAWCLGSPPPPPPPPCNHQAFSVDYASDKCGMVKGGMQIICASIDPSQCGSRLSSLSRFGTGSYSVLMKAAPGSGVATNFYLYTHGRQNDRSRPWNEIDFELLGKQIGSQSTKIWTNYFVGQGTQFPEYIVVPFDASASYHNYTIAIAGVTIEWIVDGTTYRVADMSAYPDMLDTIALANFQALLSVWGRSKQSAKVWKDLGVLDDNANTFPLKAFFDEVRLPDHDGKISHAVSMAGCPRTASHKYPQMCELATMKRSVRCCSFDGKAVPMKYGCNAGKTFQEALGICSMNKLRLCSAIEIAQNLACGVGCGFDGQRIWTLSGCQYEIKTSAGCPRSSSNRIPQGCAAATTRMSVRCCTMDGNRVPMSTYGCNTLKTYREAANICSSHALRLCSLAEVERNVACGTGCGFDGHRVWTSTQCI